MEKIVLFYKFVPISDTETTMFWQRALCQRENLKGRILISQHGINGTVGGRIEAVKAYVREVKQHPAFADMPWKWSDGSAADFPKLQVRVRDEIVAFDAADELRVTNEGVVNGGRHLSPTELHELVDELGDDVIFYDGRNPFEAEIGRFKNAIVADVEHSRDFKHDLENGEISKYKDRPIVTYCTGGIRCEVLTSLMHNRGYKNVYQLDGGIVKYGEEYGADGLWDGKLFVFDGRMQLAFSEDSTDIASCYSCGKPSSRQVNAISSERRLVVCCPDCPTPTD